MVPLRFHHGAIMTETRSLERRSHRLASQHSEALHCVVPLSSLCAQGQLWRKFARCHHRARLLHHRYERMSALQQPQGRGGGSVAGHAALTEAQERWTNIRHRLWPSTNGQPPYPGGLVQHEAIGNDKHGWYCASCKRIHVYQASSTAKEAARQHHASQHVSGLRPCRRQQHVEMTRQADNLDWQPAAMRKYSSRMAAIAPAAPAQASALDHLTQAASASSPIYQFPAPLHPPVALKDTFYAPADPNQAEHWYGYAQQSEQLYVLARDRQGGFIWRAMTREEYLALQQSWHGLFGVRVP